MDFEDPEPLLAALERERVEYAIFCAKALNLHRQVITPRTVYRMKRDTIRLKDRADAEMLEQRFELEEP